MKLMKLSCMLFQREFKNNAYNVKCLNENIQQKRQNGMGAVVNNFQWTLNYPGEMVRNEGTT